ncbi:D-tyrosyl-tRNA(Tyr) deacylase [Bifidobacterium sp. B4001]|uniref:D-aminoacyl-tRNA deacylase n=1 Tax=unclassified Bifidobacterium TaxID=2608897 RepID=UPI00226B51A1|nr:MULTISPECIES: D-aminoacyl-tRNA deacylase [unclassified Bifidobacterium]MCX8672589.1 D-tyrosyl-tRNA(Tyr) deacylase [Bifidobacterium sp. B4079]MCX8681022.1 D-tyrosyl-tRNA(Tyr) deacylase [Bifidobacterium sp. B4001]
MRIVIQRVSRARVDVVDEQGQPDPDFKPQSIGTGLLLLVAIQDEDGIDQVDYAVRKLTRMRIFSDEEGRMNRSVLDCGGSILSISQFTLYADLHRGNRPSFMAAGEPQHAQSVWQDLNRALAATGVPIVVGRFGAHMRVDSVNDGPVTILLDTDKLMKTATSSAAI